VVGRSEQLGGGLDGRCEDSRFSQLLVVEVVGGWFGTVGGNETNHRRDTLGIVFHSSVLELVHGHTESHLQRILPSVSAVHIVTFFDRFLCFLEIIVLVVTLSPREHPPTDFKSQRSQN